MNRSVERGAWGVGLLVALATAMLAFSGCESTDGGGGEAQGGMYYGVGFYDPWYHGGYYYDRDVIVAPPGRPGAPAQPTHPIATPPAATPRPTPMPSIPSMPRASLRR